VSNLLPSLGVNFEEQRRLDTEALKNQIDCVADDVVNQLEQLNSQGNSSKMMELLTDIKSNSDDTKIGLHKVGEKIGDKIDKKFDEVVFKILNEINLSRDEKQKRQELLGQVIIPPSARVEVKETVLGMGGFGTVCLGFYMILRKWPSSL
jgi:hypothetical protein